jgi:two-component system, response regulator PdtaR
MASQLAKDPAPLVLVAEDQELVRLYAVGLLEEAGFEVIDVPDAESALRTLARRPDVRVLFTDVQMPGRFDGLELARKVHEQWPNVLFLVTSGDQAPSKPEIADHGHFLAKPYTAGEVLTEIAKLEKEHEERNWQSPGSQILGQ